MTKIPNVEETAKEIIDKVKYYAICNQYPDNSEEAKAYLEGINTAMAMLYIDLTGAPKAKGFLTTYAKTQRTALLTELREYTVNLKGVYSAHDVQEAIKAHINNLIKPDNL